MKPIIIGGGLAGLLTALHLAPEPVVLLAQAPLGSATASGWAQGGIAAALSPEDNSAQHLADTLAAGDGLCDVGVAARIIDAAPAAVESLVRHGVRFDRAADGAWCYGLEAAHNRRRILGAAGDGTGAEIMRALIAAVRGAPSITVLEGSEAQRLIIRDGAVCGVLAANTSGPLLLASNRIVIATGGIGGVFDHTTNPLSSIGQGLVLAARAGARLADLEFVQFHPTALDIGRDPMPLVSEAVRGEGAVLIDETGARFLAAMPNAELAPRNVVASAVQRHQQAGHRVFLDARTALGPSFAVRFPAIAALCTAVGLDPARHPLPVAPAAHYHMGGIAVDIEGRSSVPGLWACGEAAATGLHGANRLASNSLLEAAVCARWVAESVAGTGAGPALPLALPRSPAIPDPAPVRGIIASGLGVLRDVTGLRACIDGLLAHILAGGATADPALVGMMIAVAALRRRESRGSHRRADFPAVQAGEPCRSTLTLTEAMATAHRLDLRPVSAQGVGG